MLFISLISKRYINFPFVPGLYHEVKLKHPSVRELFLLIKRDD